MIIALLSVIVGTVIVTIQFFQGTTDIVFVFAWAITFFGMMHATAIYTDLVDRLEKLEEKKKK